MNVKQKDLIDKTLKAQGSKKLYPTDKATAVLMVNEIIDALKIKQTFWEKIKALIKSDFDFWEKVKTEIEAS